MGNPNNKKIVVVSDIHIPFHMRSFIALKLIPFLKDYKPDEIIINGDMMDMYAISKFIKYKSEYVNNLSLEFQLAANLINTLLGIAPVTYILGNHEFRLDKYIHMQAKELWFLKGLTIKEQLIHEGVKESPRFKIIRYGQPYVINGLVFVHGDYCRNFSCFTAKAHFDKYHRSVINGHTHRLGHYYITIPGQPIPYQAVECGCLCDPSKADYVQSPNWQQGFVTAELNNGLWQIETHPIIRGNIWNL